jgi:asparagine synthase (glutamine-hydrolysing)
VCGIVGIYNTQTNKAVDVELLASMRDAMAHRGPDGKGIWISDDGRVGLAHRRLSIIDLDPRATQPMCNEDCSVWVTFNGEIYNHLSLRKELEVAGHHFKTDHSDTEVLVHGYEEWGTEGLLNRLEGMFGIGIWDNNQQRLTLIRDRMGVKPVYFSLQDGILRFSSEIKAILADPEVERDVDLMAMYHYLSFLTTPAPMTMFKGIFKLPAGYYMEIEKGGVLNAHRYWDALPGQGIDESDLKGLSDTSIEEYYLNGIRDRLESAVEKRMMSDVPFGVFLSGGVDSSTNVALMSRHTDNLDTFTVGFKDYEHLNELEHANRIAHIFKTNHHEILIDEVDMVGYLDDLIHHQDEPIADWVCIPLYFVSKLARETGAKVIQVGEGADEQFSGYASYMGYLDLYKKYWQPFRRWFPKPMQHATAALAKAAAYFKPGLMMYADIIQRAANDREHFWSGATVFWDLFKQQLIHDGTIQSADIPEAVMNSGLFPESYLQADTFNIIRSFQDQLAASHPDRDVLTRMIYNEFKLRLPELLLMRVDKISMSVALEARVPFLDHKLVEFTMDIPMHWKVKNGMPKYLLKKAVEGLIPDEIIYRKKMGFGAPMAQWLRGDFGKQVEAGIFESKLMRCGYFNLDYIAKLITDHRNGRTDNSLYIWTLFNLTSWYDYWIDKKVAEAV